jgi:quinoprotein glucose dehydrogenase
MGAAHNTQNVRGIVMATERGWSRLVLVFLLGLCGLALLAPGLYLLSLGGSPYYLITGIAILGAAVLLLKGERAGISLYGVMLLATLAWSIHEVGFDAWALMPRLVLPLLLGLLLLIPGVRRGLRPPAGVWPVVGRLCAGVAVVALLAAALLALRDPTSPVKSGRFAGTVAPLPATPAGDWSHFGNSLGGSRYSPLAQITPENVGKLEHAWTFRAGALIPGGKREGGLQVTPLMVDGLVYGCTAFSSVFALDPVTGKQVWRHDPPIAADDGGHAVCRGLAFFRAPAGVTECPTRILLGTVANRLIALDAKSGVACAGFGNAGSADLLEGRGDFPHRWSHPTSPPTIVKGTAVVGAYVVDNQSTDVPPGVVRGYDAVTGKLRWAFDPAHPDSTQPPEPGHVYTPATPNSWTVASGDEALGLVYVAFGNGSPDFYGAHRTPETDRFSTALVALDATTGAVRWTFQAVHHDLWDYDLASQPVLVDFPTDAGKVPGLLLPTKTGQLFVLDRRSGAPLTRVEERKVPVSTLPGERSSATQPFSVGMPDMAGPDLTEADMWGITPFDQLYCRIRFREARYEGRYTPPGLDRSIRYPGELGGIDWGSVAVDESRGVLVVNSNHMANYDQIITRAQAQAEGLVARRAQGGRRVPGGAMEGTPYAIHWTAFLSGLEVPCQRPPYGFLTAIDLATREIIWRKTFGDARNSGPFGIPTRLPLPLGAPNIGGSMTTASGLIFIGASVDETFRAIDVRDGRILWQTSLPAAGHAAPMTYLGADGRQYVLIAAGGRSLRTKGGDHFLAYRLRQE